MSDKKLERELNALKVYCVNQDKGCLWSGYLKDVDKHCNTGQSSLSVSNLEGCKYEDIRCTKCKEQIQRLTLQEHLSKGCEIECRFKYAGCKVKAASKNMKNHLEENMAVHLSLIMELTHNLSNENARMSECLSKLTTEVKEVPTQQLKGGRREIVLRTRERGVGRRIQQRPADRRQGRSLILWTGGALVILLLSMLTAHNKDTLIKYVSDEVSRYRRMDNIDPSEINLVLGDLEDQVSVMARDVNYLKETVGDDKEKFETAMEELKKLSKAIESLNGVTETVENLQSQLPDELKLKLSTLSSDLRNVGHKMDGLASNEALQLLQQRVDALSGLQRDIESVKVKLDNLPRPLSRDEIIAIVTSELASHPPHHNHHHHGHKHGGCRGRH